MATTLNIEGVKRGDLFFVPLASVIVDPKENTRFAPPNRDDLDDLKQSIRVNGQMVAAEVLLLADKSVKLIAGHQRLDMLKELEAEDGMARMLKCVLFKGNEADAVRRGIEENLRRSNPTPMDDAKNIRTLMDDYGDSVEDCAKLYHKSAAWVTSKRLPLLSLPREIQLKVHSGELGVDTALTLANLPVSDAERIAVLEDATVNAAPPTPEVEPVAPTENGPGKKKGKGDKKKKGKKETVTNTDVIRAAERRNAISPDAAPARKMTEVVKFFKELAETSITGTPINDFAKDFLKWKDRRLKDETWENKLYEYTHTKLGTVVSEGKGGKAKK